MKSRQEYKEDHLNKLMNPEGIEKAPEGFTEKLMVQIRIEPVHATSLQERRKRSIVPLVSGLVTFCLILIAVLFPGQESSVSLFPWLNYPDNLKVTIPEIGFPGNFTVSLPETMVYVMVSIFLLLIFDRALSRYFHTEKSGQDT